MSGKRISPRQASLGRTPKSPKARKNAGKGEYQYEYFDEQKLPKR